MRLLLLALVASLSVFGSIAAQTPDTLDFQGRITDLSGVPIDTTGLSTTFNLYKDGVSVWNETQSINVVDGVFNVHLGAVSPLDSMPFNEAMELGITFGKFAEMTPRTPLTSAAYAFATRGMWAVEAKNCCVTAMNVIGGSPNNSVAAGVAGATIGGGGGLEGMVPVGNVVSDDWATIGGGQDNEASGKLSTIGGGASNTASGLRSSVGGGYGNSAISQSSTVGGGQSNNAQATYTTVAGGQSNDATDVHATVGGGHLNDADGERSTVAGGYQNVATGDNAAIGGGYGNSATGGSATVGGGYQNEAANGAATVGGGNNNEASGPYSFVGGGSTNFATVDYSTVGGGSSNYASQLFAAVLGGVANVASGNSASVTGGSSNVASSDGAVVSGGSFNVAGGNSSAIPGGHQNRTTGQYSFAAGYLARANHNRTFAWNDGSTWDGVDSLVTTGTNQFLIRASGGVGIGTNDPQEMLHINADGPTGIFLGGNGAAGPHAIIFDDESAGNGVQLIWRASPNQLVIEGGSGGTDTNEPDRFVFDKDDNYFAFDANTRPLVDNTYLLGTSSYKWAAVWAFNGTINTSDARLKRGITDLDYGLSAVEALRPVRYHWKDKPELGSRLGLLAQEVEKVIPEVIEHPDTDDGYLGMRYAELVPVLIKAIQEQQDVIEALSRRVEQLESPSGSD